MIGKFSFLISTGFLSLSYSTSLPRLATNPSLLSAFGTLITNNKQENQETTVKIGYYNYKYYNSLLLKYLIAFFFLPNFFITSQPLPSY